METTSSLNIPWWAWLALALLVMDIWVTKTVGDKWPSDAKGLIAFFLVLFTGTVLDPPALLEPYILKYKTDKPLTAEFEKRESQRFQALSITSLTISCDSQTKTLQGKFLLDETPFLLEKNVLAKSQTSCSEGGDLVLVTWSESGLNYVVATSQSYKTYLVLDEIDKMVTAQFRGLTFRPDIARNLDRKQTERFYDGKLTAVRFLCEQGTFSYDVKGRLLKGETHVRCDIQKDRPAPQLQIISREKKSVFLKETNSLPDLYVTATNTITETQYKLLFYEFLENDGRRTTF